MNTFVSAREITLNKMDTATALKELIVYPQDLERAKRFCQPKFFLQGKPISTSVNPIVGAQLMMKNNQSFVKLTQYSRNATI